jgi:hypothetical protein
VAVVIEQPSGRVIVVYDPARIEPEEIRGAAQAIDYPTTPEPVESARSG